MTKKTKCDHCGAKLTGFNNWPNSIGDLVVCIKCYEDLEPFSIITKYENLEDIDRVQSSLLNRLEFLGYSETQIQQASIFMEGKKKTYRETFESQEQNENRILFDSGVDSGLYDDKINEHLTTTGFNVEGHTIEEYFGVVTGEMVLGTGFFSGFGAGVSDLLGVEADQYRNKLIEARKVAMRRVIVESLYLGGNALIGVDIDYIVFMNDLMGITITGTSVKIK